MSHMCVLLAALKAAGDWSPDVSSPVEIPGCYFVGCKNIDFDSNQFISAWGYFFYYCYVLGLEVLVNSLSKCVYICIHIYLENCTAIRNHLFGKCAEVYLSKSYLLYQS